MCRVRGKCFVALSFSGEDSWGCFKDGDDDAVSEGFLWQVLASWLKYFDIRLNA